MPTAAATDAGPSALRAIVEATLRDLHPGAAGLPPVGPDSVLDRDLGLDSLARMELLLRTERAFGVDLPAETLQRAETVADVWRAVQQGLARRGAAGSAGAGAHGTARRAAGPDAGWRRRDRRRARRGDDPARGAGLACPGAPGADAGRRARRGRRDVAQLPPARRRRRGRGRRPAARRCRAAAERGPHAADRRRLLQQLPRHPARRRDPGADLPAGAGLAARGPRAASHRHPGQRPGGGDGHRARGDGGGAAAAGAGAGAAPRLHAGTAGAAGRSGARRWRCAATTSPSSSTPRAAPATPRAWR